MSVLMGNTIDNNGPINRPNARAGQSLNRVDPTQRPAAPRSADASAASHVQFSDSVAMLQRMHDQISTEPSVSADRVAAARLAIADGSYEINHEKIVSALMVMDKNLP